MTASLESVARQVAVHEGDIAKVRRRVAYLEYLVEQQADLLKTVAGRLQYGSPTDMLIDGPHKHCTATERLMRQRIQTHAMRTASTILEKLMPDEGEEEQ